MIRRLYPHAIISYRTFCTGCKCQTGFRICERELLLSLLGSQVRVSAINPLIYWVTFYTPIWLRTGKYFADLHIPRTPLTGCESFVYFSVSQSCTERRAPPFSFSLYLLNISALVQKWCFVCITLLITLSSLSTTKLGCTLQILLVRHWPLLGSNPSSFQNVPNLNGFLHQLLLLTLLRFSSLHITADCSRLLWYILHSLRSWILRIHRSSWP